MKDFSKKEFEYYEPVEPATFLQEIVGSLAVIGLLGLVLFLILGA